MKSKEQTILTSFLSLTEKITNSKTNILDFGSPDMIFHRGEIHIIKMIGEFPNINCSEIARKFGITRAVVHRTIGILQKRELIDKIPDETNKKRFNLQLTEKGQRAYQLHEDYHQTYDKELYDYLSELNANELTAIEGFLDHATSLIDNHA